MNDLSKREIEICSVVADRMLRVLADAGIHEKKLSLMMDLEFLNDVIPLDFDALVAFNDADFAHDTGGIYKHWNRATKKLECSFVPRCAKPEAYTGEGNENDGTIPNRPLAPPASTDEPEPGSDLGIEVRIVERESGYDVVVEFDAHIETYHYDDDLSPVVGKERAVENFVESWGELFTVSAVAIALGTAKAKPIGPTVGEQFDRSRAVNLYLMAARDLGTNLGGYDLVDLLADKTDWALDKCRRLAKYVVTENSVVELLTSEGVPKDIDPPGVKRGRKPYAGTQFESDDEITARVVLVSAETSEQVEGTYTGANRYDIVAQAFQDLTDGTQFDDGQTFKVLAYDPQANDPDDQERTEPDIEMYPGGAAHRDVMGYNDGPADPPDPDDYENG